MFASFTSARETVTILAGAFVSALLLVSAAGAWVGVVRSSVYVSGHVEYVVDFGKFSVRTVGPEDPRLPHDARTRLHVSPPAVRVWPRGETAAGANGGKAR